MSGVYDEEMQKLEEGPLGQAASVQALAAELARSKEFGAGRVSCKISRGNTLEVSIKGQVVGIWKQDSANLLLFRPGDDHPETTATGVTEAAAMTARLVAAAGQA